MTASVLARARAASGLPQGVVAHLARTSRPTLSAYEHGRTSPTLDTASRVLAAMGRELDTVPIVTFSDKPGPRGAVFAVPDRLWRLPVAEAFAVVALPLALDWSTTGAPSDLRDRRQRARVYDVVLREGRPDDIRRYVDGALLVDLWDELVLPRTLRTAWDAVITAELDQVGP